MEYQISRSTLVALNLPPCAILAIDSRVCDNEGNVGSNTYNKIIQLRPCVFLACYGVCSFIDQLKDALLANLPNHNNIRLIGEIAEFVQNTVNTVLDNLRDENREIIAMARSPRFARFVLVGRCAFDSRHYFYMISKGEGENSWMYFAKRLSGKDKVVCCGASTVGRFLEANNLDENMSEEQVVDYAFRSVRYSVSEEEAWFSGGKIQVVVMKSDSSIVHAWEQNDPTDPQNEYHYQGARINHGL